MQTNVRMTSAWPIMEARHLQRMQKIMVLFQNLESDLMVHCCLLNEVEPPNWLFRQRLHETQKHRRLSTNIG